MDSFFGYYDWLVVGLLGIFLLNVILNAVFFPSVKRRKVKSGRESRPKVSVMIPARNEGEQIERCLESLMAQTYSSMEIIVLDDCSEDNTAEIVNELGFSEAPSAARRLVKGQPLPKGWAGKPWACYQLSRQATGDFFLFVDADTVHHEASVESAVAMALKKQTHLLSVWPHQITLTWSEKLVIPMIYLLAQMWIPYWFLNIAQKSPKKYGFIPKRWWECWGSANGQYLLFTRDAYKQLGSHQLVKDHLVEDVAFGRAVTKRLPQGWRLLNADGHAVVECRMYHEFMEVWEGFTKNLRPAFEWRSVLFVVVGLVMAITLLLPFLWFVIRESPWLVSLQTQIILLIRLIPTVRFSTSWWSLLAHPFAVVLGMAIAINSWIACRRGKLSWKRRDYHWRPPAKPSKGGEKEASAS